MDAVLPLLLGAMFLNAPPSATVPMPSLHVGEELVYSGDVVEESLRRDQAWKRNTKVEVRYLVLAVRDGNADLAALTLLRTQDDAGIARTAETVTGAAKESGRKAPAVRLELIRLDAAGTLKLLAPEAAPPPLLLSNRTVTKNTPSLPLDAPNAFELGAFPVRPISGAKPGQRWPEAQIEKRPEIQWSAQPPMVLDGAEVIEFLGEQRSEKWLKPTAMDSPWQRTERVWLSPSDGIARVIWRRIERKEGPHLAARLETRLDLQPTVPLRGESFERVKREIEFAWYFAAQLNDLPAEQRPALAARISRYCEDYSATPYREAVQAAARRCQAIGK